MLGARTTRQMSGRNTGACALSLTSLCAVIAGSGRAVAEPTELSPEVAYGYGETETARSGAMAGALRATGNGTTAVFQNPADMVETRIYHLEGLAQITPEANRQIYGGAIVDSVTGRLAGGIAISGGFIDPDGLDRTSLDVRLALAYPITERLFVGLGGRYAKVSQSGRGPFGDSAASGGLRDPEGGRFAFVNTFTFDAGLTVKATDAVYIAVVGQNLTYPNHSLVPTTVGGGLGFADKNFTIELDSLADFNSWGETSARLMLGAELLLGDHFPLRGGYRFDQGADMHSLSAGVGYVGTEFSVEGGVRRALADPGPTTIFIGLAYFLESSGLTRRPTDFD